MDPSLSLNVHLTVPPGNHTESHTPNTPEILNSIVNMTNGPFANYPTGVTSEWCVQDRAPTSSTCGGSSGGVSSSVSSSTYSPSSPSEKSSGLSVQQYCSQFIKEGLKMKVKRKLGVNNAPSAPKESPPLKKPKICITPAPEMTEKPAPSPPSKPPRVDVKEELLSPEDLAKRLRRRERNKLAATKCRNKKKAQYTILAQEHEDLKRHNSSFKSERARLEAEKRKLAKVLEKHRALLPSCPLFLVKKEEESLSSGMMHHQEREIDPSLGLRRSCSFSNSQQASSSDFFLGKSAITQSFYDLSSRCMAM